MASRRPFLVSGARSASIDDAAEPTDVRTIRLRRLQSVVREGLRPGARLDAAALGLFGITRLDGFLTDDENRDVLLFGQVDRRFPALRLEDLITAMRNVWLSASDPACSIDPEPADLAALMEILGAGRSATSPQQMRALIDRVVKACRRPQRVSVFGVPRSTSFAHTMVRADYHMKQVAAGVVPHPSGQRSFKDLGFDALAGAARRTCTSAEQTSVMARFWFYPDTPSYERAEGIFAIRELEIRLLTEEEHLRANGQREQTGRSHPAAAQFARDFTASYRQAARQAPVYAELRGLYRAVAMAIFLHRDEALERAGLDVDLWLRDYPQERAGTPATVEGVGVVKEEQLTCNTPRGTLTGAIWMPMCGGVGVSRAVVGDRARVARGNASLAEVPRRVLGAEPKPGRSLHWDVRLPSFRGEHF